MTKVIPERTIKEIEVSSCRTCPYHDTYDFIGLDDNFVQQFYEQHFCYKVDNEEGLKSWYEEDGKGNAMEDFPIPEWCPLPDR